MGDGSALTMSPLFMNGTFPARAAIIAESQFVYSVQTDGLQYDQVCVAAAMPQCHPVADALPLNSTRRPSLCRECTPATWR